MVVAVLVLGFAAVLAPAMSGALNARRMNSDARNISFGLVTAKMKAMSQGEQYQVFVEPGQNGWRLQKSVNRTQIFQDEGSPVTLSSGVGESGIKLKAGSSTAPPDFPTASSTFIRFNSRGMPINETGRPTMNNAIYLGTDRTMYAVT